MKEFFLILFFARMVLLTPEPVDLHGQLVLTPAKSLEAITPGASIQIDVSSLIKWGEKEDILAFRKRLEGRFPSGGIGARLIGRDSQEVVLRYEGNHQFNESSVMLSLYADEGVPTNIEFTKVILESDVELKGVRVFWKNYKN